MQEGVEVKLARDANTAETVILCRSADRRSKEQAMHDRFSRRIEAALERLAGRIAQAKKPLDAAAVNRQIGRLMQRNQRAAARFVVSLQPDQSPAGFHLRVAHSAAFDDWAALSKGAYLLRSNITEWTDRRLWKAYIQLTQRKRRSAFRKISSTSDRSGTSARTACRPTSSFASWHFEPTATTLRLTLLSAG